MCCSNTIRVFEKPRLPQTVGSNSKTVTDQGTPDKSTLLQQPLPTWDDLQSCQRMISLHAFLAALGSSRQTSRGSSSQQVGPQLGSRAQHSVTPKLTLQAALDGRMNLSLKSH
jgi:hypothetical protein